jgi:hypothetical protein
MQLLPGDRRKNRQEKVSSPRRRRWRTFGIAFLILVVLLIGARLALAPLLLRFVNQKLDEIPDYRGHIEDVDLELYRGAYRIEGMVLEKESGKIPVPFFKARSVDLSVEWNALLRKRTLVGEIVVTGPEVNFVVAPPKAGPKAKREMGQTSIDSSWTEKVKQLFPFEINRFAIREGQIHYRDLHRNPKVDIHLDHLEAEAAGLTNTRRGQEDLPAEFHAVGRAMGHANLKIDMKLAPLAQSPTFDLNAELTGLRLKELNDFFRAYAKVDVSGGTFGLYTEAAAADGRFKGYLKPVVKDLQVLGGEDEEDNPFRKAWEAVVAGVSEVLENQPKEQTATQIPFSGSLDHPEAGIWPTVGTLLRNAFLEALRPSLNRSIGIGDVKKKASEGGESAAGDEAEPGKRKKD